MKCIVDHYFQLNESFHGGANSAYAPCMINEERGICEQGDFFVFKVGLKLQNNAKNYIEIMLMILFSAEINKRAGINKIPKKKLVLMLAYSEL